MRARAHLQQFNALKVIRLRYKLIGRIYSYEILKVLRTNVILKMDDLYKSYRINRMVMSILPEKGTRCGSWYRTNDNKWRDASTKTVPIYSLGLRDSPHDDASSIGKQRYYLQDFFLCTATCISNFKSLCFKVQFQITVKNVLLDHFSLFVISKYNLF